MSDSDSNIENEIPESRYRRLLEEMSQRGTPRRLLVRSMAELMYYPELINVASDEGRTLLMILSGGSEEARSYISDLISRFPDININQRDNNGDIALCYASNSVSTARILVQNGSDLDNIDNNGTNVIDDARDDLANAEEIQDNEEANKIRETIDFYLNEQERRQRSGRQRSGRQSSGRQRSDSQS